MSDQKAMRLHRVSLSIARRLVDAGLDTPTAIREAPDKALREALKGPGVTNAVKAVRAAYRK